MISPTAVGASACPSTTIGSLVSERGCVITGWGTALPPTIVSNTDLTSILDTSDEWIVERSGVHARRAATGPFVSPAPALNPPGGLGTTAALAIEAGRQALDSADTRPEEIGFLVVCTSTPDQVMPATSSTVAGVLGIAGGAVDLNAACAGFTYGLITAAGLLAAGSRKVLLIGAETMTRTLNWEDRTNAFLFGDGAGALVLEAVNGPGSLLGWDAGVDGTLVDLLYVDHGAGMVMRGQEVFRRAVRATVDSVNAALKNAGVGAEEIALFVPHQANQRIMEAIAGPRRDPERPDRLGDRLDRQHQFRLHPPGPRRGDRAGPTLLRGRGALRRLRCRHDLGLGGVALGSVTGGPSHSFATLRPWPQNNSGWPICSCAAWRMRVSPASSAFRARRTFASPKPCSGRPFATCWSAMSRRRRSWRRSTGV